VYHTASQTAALEAEILSGSNQYACDYCMHKADATRQMALRSVPPYLCLPLQRFVYDYKKGDKVKASDRWVMVHRCQWTEAGCIHRYTPLVV
jgi:ubiquitin C-terminal hydrolase